MFQYFYHERIRKSVATFGTLFNNIHVQRTGSNGAVISQTKVPLSYAPKDKYLERIRENPSLIDNTKVALKLPRISFEITSLAYDPERSLPKSNNYNKAYGGSNTQATKIYAPAPYTIFFQLNIYAKLQDDALQIVEQILPYFNPHYNLTLKPFELHPDIKEDVGITLQSVSFQDDFEGSLEQRRTIIYTLDFGMKVNFHGPFRSNNIINKAITDIYFDKTNYLAGDSDGLVVRSTIEPNPLNASPFSDFGFTTTVDYYEDSA
jgi:hypothetical protein|tara:strand:- start:6714 stop:7502 length:789 start_codon:yes stop_codon:yes gene_type:complete